MNTTFFLKSGGAQKQDSLKVFKSERVRALGVIGVYAYV